MALPVWPVAALALLALAGCADPASPFEEALAAPGDVYDSEDPAIRLKMLEPAGSDVSTGPLPVRFLLYDAQAETPVLDASFPHEAADCEPAASFCAEHLEHRHGTSPEQTPQHAGDGIYAGSTTMSMEGPWRLHLNPQLGDGRTLEFDVPLEAS